MSKTRIIGQDQDLTAANIDFVPNGSIASTDVQAAIQEVRDEASGSGISATIVDAKGDLITASAADTPVRLPVGTDGQILYADSGETGGLIWDDPTGGSVPVPWMLVPDSGTERNSALSLGAANRIILVPAVLNVAATITGCRIVVVNSTGNISVALYDSSANPVRLATSGSVACPAAGRADVNFTGNYSAAAGRYYLALSASSNSATFAAVVVTGTGMLGRLMETAHPAPDPVTFAGETNNTMCIVGRISGGYP